MPRTGNQADRSTHTAEFWERRYRRQQQLIAAVTSLLSRYGSTVNTDELHRAFLLTLMGHFGVGDAVLYAPTGDGSVLEPVLVYGTTPKDALPVLTLDDASVAGLARRRRVGALRSRDGDVGRELAALGSRYQLLAPLSLKNKLLGIVFLGPRLSGESYDDFDTTLLDSLAAVSAATFNDALLYRNARLSTEELRKLLEVRSDVISRISHEFRTPLTVLRAGIEMLPDTPPREWMSESVDRLERLIESLLALGHDDPAAPAARTDALAAVHEAAGSLAAAAAKRRIGISVSCSETAAPLIAGIARDNLQLILHALLENAIAYSPEDSAIDVRVESVDGGHDAGRDGIRLPEWVASTLEQIAELAEIYDSLDHGPTAPVTPARRSRLADESLRHVVIRVIDHGIGIPADEIALVAEPFRQASNCPDRGVKGKGLGLAIARRCAEAAGGFLCCRSAAGSGTTVSVFLPVL